MGLDARFHEALDTKLCCLGLLFAECTRLNDIGQCHEADAPGAFLESQLTQGLDVEAVLVVTNGPADFDKDDIGRSLAVATQGQFAELAFHLAGDMGDHLDIATKVHALAFAVEDLGVDLP